MTDLSNIALYNYGKPSHRLLAYLIDFIVTVFTFSIVGLGILSFVSLSASKMLLDLQNTNPAKAIIITAVPVILLISMLIIAPLYYSLCESSKHQATIGKKILKLKVTDTQGNRISFPKALARYFAKYLSGIFYIGYIIIFFTEKKQCLHDLITNCLVLSDADN